jgi:hypothetical protein
MSYAPGHHRTSKRRTLSSIGSVRCLAAAGAAALLSRLNNALGLAIPPSVLLRADQVIE